MLTQQLGRYLFKTFRTLLANPEAPMSKENKTREYILKVRPFLLYLSALHTVLTVALLTHSTFQTRMPRPRRNTPVISRTPTSTFEHSDIELPTLLLPLSEREMSNDELGTVFSLTFTDARKFLGRLECL